MTKGVFVYIDCSNLNETLKALNFEGVDYPRLINWLKSKQKVSRVYLYAGYWDEAEKNEYLQFEKHGYVVYLKRIKQYYGETKKRLLTCPNCGKKHLYGIRMSGRRKANCDADLTLDVINDGVRKKYDGIIVFSADGDFARIYEYVSRELSKPVTVFTPMGKIAGKRTSTRLKELHQKGIIKINALEGILGDKGYGIK